MELEALRLSLYVALRSVALGLPLAIAAGYAVGRTGCWAVGDDYRRPSSGPLAVSFPEGAPPSTVLEMQRFASAAQPYLRANALVGITGMKKVVFGGVKPLYRVPVELFDDPAAARDWLAER